MPLGRDLDLKVLIVHRCQHNTQVTVTKIPNFFPPYFNVMVQSRHINVLFTCYGYSVLYRCILYGPVFHRKPQLEGDQTRLQAKANSEDVRSYL
jgi:hypothetical protein